jgi:hypothetical protein
VQELQIGGTGEPEYDEQIIARAEPRVQPQAHLWFPAPHRDSCERCGNFKLALTKGRQKRKKEPPFPAAFEVDNREASNRVDRSHSVSKEDAASHT